MAQAATSRSKLATVLIIMSCCLGAAGEGLDLQAPGVTLPVLAPLFDLSTGNGFWEGLVSEKSLFLSMSTFGLILGALIGGRLSDLLGRKWVAVISVVLFALGSAVTAHATSAEGLLWCRFFTGLGIGGAMPNLITIVAETVPANRRAAAIGFLYGSLPAGGALVSLASYLFGTEERWGYIYYLGAIVPLLALPGLILAVPNLRPAPRSADENRPSFGTALFGEGRASRTLALWGAFFLALLTMHVLLSWLPTLLVAKGLPREEASLVQLGVNVSAALGAFATGVLMDRMGRTGAVAMAFAGSVVAIGVLAVAPATLAISFVVGCLNGCMVSAMQAVLYILAPDCYPARVRGTGVGSAVSVGRMGSAAGPLLAGALLGSGASPTRVLMLLVPMVIVGAFMAVFVAPRAQEKDGAAAPIH